MKSTVVIMPCDRYDKDLIKEKIAGALETIGGPEKIIGKDEKVLLKLNLVRSAPPERAVTTHPAVAAATAELLREVGYSHVSAGDSCGFGSSVKCMQSVGMAAELQAAGAKLAEFKDAVKVDFPEGVHAKSFMIASDILDADAVISVCKMKTHALEHITGAVKNQYGCVQGVNKAKGHTVYPSAESFGRMLIDLNRFVNPRLFIMDGIVAMEGNGPTSGDPVPMNLLMLSTDPVALDTVFAHLVHLDPDIVPTIFYGNQMGLGTSKKEDISLILFEDAAQEAREISFQEAYECFGNPDFNVVRKRQKAKGLMGAVDIFQVFRKRPYIVEDRCKKCGICVESCPVEGKALRFSKGRDHVPVYHYKKCIRCFCCQEMCPHKAISVKGRGN